MQMWGSQLIKIMRDFGLMTILGYNRVLIDHLHSVGLVSDDSMPESLNTLVGESAYFAVGLRKTVSTSEDTEPPFTPLT